LVRPEKCADFDALATRNQRQPLRAELLVLDALEAHPDRVEAPFASSAARRDPSEKQFERGKAQQLISASGAKIGAEGKIDQKNVQAEKADDGPSAHEIKGQAIDSRESAAGEHQNLESARSQRSMRTEALVEEQRLVLWRLSHALSKEKACLGAAPKPHYKAQMARAKSPTKAAARRPAKKRAPRPADAARVEEIFERFAAALPEPKGELEFRNHYTLLVAVVLSAQATDTGVNKATRDLFPLADTPEKMIALGEKALIEKIKTIGLYRNKAKNVIALSLALLRDHHGRTPSTREALEALPGVGRKTANVVLNIAFGQETIAVDTHVFRVSNRLPLAPGRTPAEVEVGLERIVPKPFKRHAHHWLILHGRYVCKARSPLCGGCLVADLCQWEEKRVPAGQTLHP
jgi:endonuclease III